MIMSNETEYEEVTDPLTGVTVKVPKKNWLQKEKIY